MKQYLGYLCQSHGHYSTHTYHIRISEEDRKKIDIMRSNGVDLSKLLREYIRNLFEKGNYHE